MDPNEFGAPKREPESDLQVDARIEFRALQKARELSANADAVARELRDAQWKAERAYRRALDRLQESIEEVS